MEFSAECFNDSAIFLGLSQVKTPSSKSRANEVLVTLPDQYFFATPAYFTTEWVILISEWVILTFPSLRRRDYEELWRA